MKKALNVDEYIEHAPIELQNKLRELRSVIKEVAPEAEEKISYGMPYYGYKGRLAYFAYAKNHIGLYLMPPLIEENKKKLLMDYSTSMSAVRFPNDKKLPITLIKKLVKIGVGNNERKFGKKK